MEDLANLFNCSDRTLVNDLAALRKAKVVPPLLSTIKDMGRAITHRRLIVTLWLQGFEYSEIARSVDGLPVHNFESLMSELATRARVTYSMKSKEFDLRIKQQAELTALQRRAYALLGLLPVAGK